MRAAKERPLTAATVNGPKSDSHPQFSQYPHIRQPENDLTERITGIDLLAVVEAAGVHLSKRGARYVGRCLFHAETTPSFYVFQDKEKGRFHCFGCGESGDALDFVQKAYGLDFKGALGQLGLKSSKVTPELSKKIRRSKHGTELVSSFRKWVDRQIDVACLVIHTCNRHTLEIKAPDDLEKYGKFYHLLAKAEYKHLWLCGASDAELYRLYQEGGLYV